MVVVVGVGGDTANIRITCMDSQLFHEQTDTLLRKNEEMLISYMLFTVEVYSNCLHNPSPLCVRQFGITFALLIHFESIHHRW